METQAFNQGNSEVKIRPDMEELTFSVEDTQAKAEEYLQAKEEEANG